MKWKIDYSRDAEKFIERENIRGETREDERPALESLINIWLQEKILQS